MRLTDFTKEENFESKGRQIVTRTFGGVGWFNHLRRTSAR
jgi:hypothetical protein